MRTLTFSMSLVFGVSLLSFGALAQDAKKPAPAYKVDTSQSATTLKPGEQGALSFHIQPIEGKKVHPDAPLEIKLTDTAALKAAKKKLGRKDVVEKKAYDPEVRTASGGEISDISSKLLGNEFFLCDKEGELEL